MPNDHHSRAQIAPASFSSPPHRNDSFVVLTCSSQWYPCSRLVAVMDRFVIRLPKPESPLRVRTAAKPGVVKAEADTAAAKRPSEAASTPSQPAVAAATPPSPAFRSGRRLASCRWWRSMHHLAGSAREQRALAISTVADHELVVFERMPSPDEADAAPAAGLAEEASRDASIQHIAFDGPGVLFAIANSLGVVSIFDYSEVDMALAHIRNAMATNSSYRLPPEGHVSVHPVSVAPQWTMPRVSRSALKWVSRTCEVWQQGMPAGAVHVCAVQVHVLAGPRQVHCIQWNDSGVGDDRENELVVASSQHRHLWYYDVATLPSEPCVLLVNGETLDPGGVGRGTAAQGYLCVRFLKAAAQPVAGGAARAPATASTAVGGGGAASARAGAGTGTISAISLTRAGKPTTDGVFDVCAGTFYDAGHAPPPRIGHIGCAFAQTSAWMTAKEAARRPPQLPVMHGAAKSRGGAAPAAAGGSTAGAAGSAAAREVRVIAGDTTGKVRLWAVPERAVREPPPPVPASHGSAGRPPSPGGSPRAARRLKPAWEVAVVDALNIAVTLHKAALEEEERKASRAGRAASSVVRPLSTAGSRVSLAVAAAVARTSSAALAAGADPVSSSFNTGVSLSVRQPTRTPASGSAASGANASADSGSVWASRPLPSPASSDDGSDSTPPTLLRQSWRSDQLQVCEVFQGQGPLASSHVIAVTTGGVVAVRGGSRSAFDVTNSPCTVRSRCGVLRLLLLILVVLGRPSCADLGYGDHDASRLRYACQPDASRCMGRQ